MHSIFRTTRALTAAVLCCLLGALTTNAAAQSDAPNTPRDVFMVLAGGASLGAYEAGYAATIAQFLRDNPEHYTLRGIAGTSAGGINAFASALEYCKDTDSIHTETHQRYNDPRPQSVPWNTWIPMDWSMIYDADKVSAEAVFHFEHLFEHGLALLEPKDYTLRPDCDVPIHVAVTQESHVHKDNDPTHALELIEYLAVRLQAKPTGEARYVQRRPRDHRPPHRLTPIARQNGSISAHEVMRMITATAAFPVGFPSVPMTVQGPSPIDPDREMVTLDRTYYDGGIFDNVPVGALLPDLEASADNNPLVLIVDLDNQRIPHKKSPLDSQAGNLSAFTRKWLNYARARTYAEAAQTLKDQGVEHRRAHQRYPAAGGFLASFAGFLDRNFRETDYLLGAFDALEDLRDHNDTAQHNPRAAAESIACMESILTTEDLPSCAQEMLPPSIIATLRGLAHAAASRCEGEEIRSMGCERFRQENLLHKLPPATRSQQHQRALKRSSVLSPQNDFDAFLHELHSDDFEPTLPSTARKLAPYYVQTPTYLFSRNVEDALQNFAAKQNGSHLRTELAFDAILQTSLAIPPRASASLLLNLQGLSATLNLPVSHRISFDLGAEAEWGIMADRTKRWHMLSGGPVARFGVHINRRQAILALMADVHAGVLFGPTFPSVTNDQRGIGGPRYDSRPNAAVYVGVAPRLFILRRLQLDLPIRAYWLCETSSCTSFVDRKPAYSISVRIGWNWTLPTSKSH